MTNNGLKLVDILSSVDSIVRSRKSAEESQFMSVREQVSAPTRRLSLQPQEVEFDTRSLEDVTLGMITEYTMYSMDNTYTTKLLKNTNHTGTMLLDGVRNHLSQYGFLKCVVVNEKDVVFQFVDPLDRKTLTELIQSSGTSYEINFKEAKTGVGTTRTAVNFDGVHMLTIGNYSVSLPYRNLVQDRRLEEGLQAALGLVTRIHQDRLFREGIRTIYFAEYQPIFKLLFPDIFEDRMTDLLEEVRRLANSGKLPETQNFQETRWSKHTDEKRYRLVETLDHIKYIVVSPDKQELYIRLGSYLDFRRIQDVVESSNLALSAERKGCVDDTKTIKKGGGYRTRTWRSYTISRDVNDISGRTLITFEWNSIVKLYLGQEANRFEQSARLFSQIYYGRLFYTGAVPTAHLGSDITTEERMLINYIDTLSSLYITFLQVDEEKSRNLQHKQPVTPIQWIAEKMAESPLKSFEERVLYVLREINNRVHPTDFAKIETKVKLFQQYAILKNLKERFEAYTAVRANAS